MLLSKYDYILLTKILLLIKEDERVPPLYGDAKNGIKVLTDDSVIYVCTLCNHNDSKCYYCLCADCWADGGQSSARVGRIREKKSPSKITHERCVHSKQDLKQRGSVHWCKKNYIGKGMWFQRANGCSSCKKMFVNIGGQGAKKDLPPDFQWPTIEQFDPEIAQYYMDYHSNGVDATRPIYDAYKKSLDEGSSKTCLGSRVLTYETEF